MDPVVDGCAWQPLWDFAEALAREVRGTPATVLDPVGLILRSPSEPAWGTYETTPRNAITFASTGGDGVHFSLLDARRGVAPVVMTVPMNWGRANLIVGEDLHDFLSLGCECGYFVLEQLTYSPEHTARAIESGGLEVGLEGRALLARLREHFAVQMWLEVEARLSSLQDRFQRVLEFETSA